MVVDCMDHGPLMIIGYHGDLFVMSLPPKISIALMYHRYLVNTIAFLKIFHKFW